jgi:hypothetical protein
MKTAPGRALATSFVFIASILTAAAADLRFGVQTHFAQGWNTTWAGTAGAEGAGGVRDELYWNQVETQPGVYTFPAPFDAYMAVLGQQGLDPLVTLDFDNPLYDGGLTPYTPDAIAAYGRYGVAVLNHYGTQIHSVEIWNEYNGSFANGPATNNLAGSYTALLQNAYAQIKAARPDVTVLGGATAGVPLPYWQALIQNGALSSMDALSIHPYRYNSAPEGIENQVGALQKLLQQYNQSLAAAQQSLAEQNGATPTQVAQIVPAPTKPIWATEIGWQLQQSTVPGFPNVDEITQAKYLVRAYALLFSAGVQRIYWYMLADDQGIVMGLNAPTGQAKPAALAMRTMASELAGASFAAKEPTLDGVYSLRFQRPSGDSVRVMWALQPATLSVQGATSATDISGQPVDLTNGLALTDSPVFVEGPLQGLPPSPANEQLLTDSSTDFSGTQGQNGWYYGVFGGSSTTFQALSNYNLSNWEGAWGGPYPYLEISAGDQHPSVWGQYQVWAVRRWVSNYTGTVRIAGQFQVGAQGDGVGVKILVNGQPVLNQLMSVNTAIAQNFDFLQTVQPGTTIDFAVSPGPGLDINYDATTFEAAISTH